MNFHFADEKLKNVEPLFRRIADQYLAMLNSSFLFRAKLDAVEVHADSRMGLDDFQGRFEMKTHPQGCSIILHVTPELSEAQTAHLIAHEIGHMLISNMEIGALVREPGGDIGVQYGVLRSDGSGRMIGIGLEEGIVDCMAEEVLCRISPEWVRELRRKEQDKARAFLIKSARELAKCFGKRLEKLQQFDQVQEIGKKVILKDESMHPVAVVSAFMNFENVFWLCLSRQSFELIRAMYDEVMGEGQFGELCQLMDAVYKQEEWTLEEKALVKLLGEKPAEYEEITQRIRRFRKLHAQKNREYKGVSERRLAADSLKAAFDMMRMRCRAMYIPEGYEAFYEAVKAFEKTLNKGRVWKSAAEARAAYDRMNVIEKPILTYLHTGVIGEILDAVGEVAAYYEEDAQPTKGRS